MKTTIVALIVIIVAALGVIKSGTIFNEQAQLALSLRGINSEALTSAAFRQYRKIAPTLRSIEDSALRDALSVMGADLNGDGLRDAIVTLEHVAVCGNAGCLTTVYVQNEQEQFEALNFKYTVKAVSVLETVTNGMRDLQINNDATLQLIWNGKTYEPNR